MAEFIRLKPSERSLVEAAKKGHATAFDALCQRYSEQLRRAAFRITRNREDAEDAVQDSLLRAFLHVKDFDGRSSFATWITRIAINSALMILRKKRSSLEMAVQSSDDFGDSWPGYELADGAPGPERRYAQSEEARILKEAICRLRPTLREVIEIQQLQERTMRETADVMGISVAAAKARLFHAKAQLRKSRALKLMRASSTPGGMGILSAA
jgi:RNA polymerase sigma-70 factor (ECF subfamily)